MGLLQLMIPFLVLYIAVFKPKKTQAFIYTGSEKAMTMLRHITLTGYSYGCTRFESRQVIENSY